MNGAEHEINMITLTDVWIFLDIIRKPNSTIVLLITIIINLEDFREPSYVLCMAAVGYK